jgi:3-oxoacyl-[acyl-carrier-protein] synthase-3
MALAKISGIDIKGIIMVLPKHQESNMDLDVIAPDKRASLIEHTGIKFRNKALKQTTVKNLFAKGIETIIDQLKWEKNEVDVIVCVTQTAMISIPSVSNQLHGQLEFGNHTMCYDINSGCSGYVYGLHTIGTLLNSIDKKNARALLCCGDVSSQLIDENDVTTRPIFSDAISITAIEKTDSNNEWAFNLETNGKGEKAIYTDELNGNQPVMKLNGIDVFSYTLSMVPNNINTLLNFASKDISYPELFVLHQANKLINESVRKKLNIPVEKAPSTLYEYGNTASASIPLTLGLNKAKIIDGNVLLCGFGVGFSVASALVNINANFHFNIIDA